MTTLEKAKRFAAAIQRRIDGFKHDKYYDWVKAESAQKRARAYRALLNHEIEGITAQDLYAKIWLEGARFARELFDAVHGRKNG